MSWLFGPSETHLLLQHINSKFGEHKNAELVTTLINNDFLGQEDTTNLKALIDKTINDYLYYHPKLKEVGTKVTEYFTKLDNDAIKQQKMMETVKETTQQISSSQIDQIQSLLTANLLMGEDVAKLADVLEKQMLNYLTTFSEADLRSLSEKIIAVKKAQAEKKDEEDQEEKRKNSMTKLALRVPEILGQISGAKSADWIVTLLTNSLLSEEQNEQLKTYISDKTVDFLSNLDEENLRELLANVAAHKQSSDLNRKKAIDLENMRRKAAVRNNISFLENLSKNPPQKPTKIIQTRSVAIPDSFVRLMGQIHDRKQDELVTPNDEKIYVKETYSNGQFRLRGAKIDNKRVDQWVWFTQSGKVYGEYNYTTHKWTYASDEKTKIRGVGPVAETPCSGPEFFAWIEEARGHLE